LSLCYFLLVSCFICFRFFFYSALLFFDLRSFPTRRSSDLMYTGRGLAIAGLICSIVSIVIAILIFAFWGVVGASDMMRKLRQMQDRKSTRLNSSHLVISYAVFCLKKKKNKTKKK